jgi:hypothetical protein
VNYLKAYRKYLQFRFNDLKGIAENLRDHRLQNALFNENNSVEGEGWGELHVEI